MNQVLHEYQLFDKECANDKLRYCISFVKGNEFRIKPDLGLIWLKQQQDILRDAGFVYQAKILGFWISKYVDKNLRSLGRLRYSEQSEEVFVK